MTTCGTCRQSVDQAEHRDAHNPKTCIDCRQELPIERFPVHKSAGDGRRRTCDVCSGAARAEQTKQHAEQRDRDRQARNKRFQARGYRWLPCWTPELHRHKLELYNPAGVPVAPSVAEQEIDQLEYEERSRSRDSVVVPPASRLPRLSFTAIDFETANAKRASVCAVGLAKVRDGIVVDAFDSLVTPPPGYQEFNPHNVAVHGINARDVKAAPAWDAVYREIEQFIGGDALVAHNASFDRSVLAEASAVHGISVPRRPWLCTIEATRSALDLRSYALPAVSAALGIASHRHHDAAADARQCAQVLISLCRRVGSGGLPVLKQHIRVW